MQLRQIVEQRLRLLQIERVEAFGETNCRPGREVRELSLACLGCAKAAPCSSPRVAPMTLPVACAQSLAHAQNTPPLSWHPAPATSAISPATRLTSASHHFSLVVCIAVIASAM